MYKIIEKTNAYIARRTGGKTVSVIADNMTLKEAQKELLSWFNYKHDTLFSNWGHAVNYCRRRIDSAVTFRDGTRSFDFDSRSYTIVADED